MKKKPAAQVSVAVPDKSPWIEIKTERDNPPVYKNVLFSFEDHWNQVVGFYCGKGKYYETSAHDHNSEIAKPGPKWWTEIPQVPHYRVSA